MADEWEFNFFRKKTHSGERPMVKVKISQRK